mmetsp:Transcript_2050/g.2844  ORF Transcript_2050/g.2844 Transcript_2050/m.2844 type:complete len:109 (+) Transcript_2050:1144-1470(+)
MVIQLLQEHDFAESTLRIRRILEGIENLFERYNFPSLLVNRFPHNAVCPFAQLGDNFIFAQDVLVNLLGHGVPRAGGGRRSDAPDLTHDPRSSASSGHHTRTSPTCSP